MLGNGGNLLRIGGNASVAVWNCEKAVGTPKFYNGTRCFTLEMMYM